MNFTKIIDLGKAMKSHTCDNKELLAADGVGKEGEEFVCYIQYVCYGCGENFQINMRDIHLENEDCDDFTKPLIKQCFNTAEGRRSFAESCK